MFGFNRLKPLLEAPKDPDPVSDTYVHTYSISGTEGERKKKQEKREELYQLSLDINIYIQEKACKHR